MDVHASHAPADWLEPVFVGKGNSDAVEVTAQAKREVIDNEPGPVEKSRAVLDDLAIQVASELTKFDGPDREELSRWFDSRKNTEEVDFDSAWSVMLADTVVAQSSVVPAQLQADEVKALEVWSEPVRVE